MATVSTTVSRWWSLCDSGKLVLCDRKDAGDKENVLANIALQRVEIAQIQEQVRRAAAKAPTHPQLLAMYAGMLNFHVFERDEGRRVLQQALEVAPADAHVLVEHAKYLAFREYNPSAAIDQLRHALQVDGV